MARKGHHPDYFFLALVFLLTVFGLVMLSSASSDLGQTKFGDSYYYLKHQLLRGLLPGVLLFVILYFTPYRFLQKAALFLIFVSIVLLALVFTNLGVRANNAQRWIDIGGVIFQPAELLKISLIIYLSAWLSNPKAGRNKSFYEGFIPLLLIFGLIAGLLISQPATSVTVVLLASALAVYFVSGAPMRFVAALVIMAIVGFVMLIAFSGSYRLERIITYFNPHKDPEAAGFHINQALITLASGGVFGLGFGASDVKQNLPARIDDSIFAIIAGEFGFIGAALIAVVFMLLTLRIFWLAKNARDSFSRLSLIGFGCVIFFQSFINMAAIAGLLPLTGLPLPFISFGGTALAVFLAMSGIIANMSRYT